LGSLSRREVQSIVSTDVLKCGPASDTPFY